MYIRAKIKYMWIALKTKTVDPYKFHFLTHYSLSEIFFLHFICMLILSSKQNKTKVSTEILEKNLILLRENCRNTEFFWSVFSCIRTEYGDLQSKFVPIWTFFTQSIS